MLNTKQIVSILVLTILLIVTSILIFQNQYKISQLLSGDKEVIDSSVAAQKKRHYTIEKLKRRGLIKEVSVYQGLHYVDVLSPFVTLDAGDKATKLHPVYEYFVVGDESFKTLYIRDAKTYSILGQYDETGITLN